MNPNNNIEKKGEVELKEIGRIFIKKIWWFIGTFLIILIAGVLFTFLRTPQYGLTSTLIISSIDQTYYQTLMEYFPERITELTGFSNITESEEMVSDKFIQKLKDNLSEEIGLDELKDTIYIYTRTGGILRLTTIYNNPATTYEINKDLLDLYLEERNDEIESAYSDLISEIDSKMSDIHDTINSDSSNLSEKEIELRQETYYRIGESRDVLIENKGFFLDRIMVISVPDTSNVYKYFSVKRDLVFSFMLAIAIGILAAFAVNYFQSLKK